MTRIEELEREVSLVKKNEHITDGTLCWCEPEVEELEDGGLLYIHRRSDN